MKKPVIGVVPLVDKERESLWMLPGYLEGLEAAGALPVILPLTEDRQALIQLMDSLDGLLFTGGQDVSPALYGETPLPQCGETCSRRDGMEQVLLELALAQDKPVLGICRGIQFLNAALGGTLYQDLPSQKPSDLSHVMTPPYDQPVHRVDLIPGSPLEKLLGCRTLEVNSYHHQGVKDLAPGLAVMARATDGLTEGVWMPERRFVWAVQWHPEFSWKSQEASRRIFAALVQAAQ